MEERAQFSVRWNHIDSEGLQAVTTDMDHAQLKGLLNFKETFTTHLLIC